MRPVYVELHCEAFGNEMLLRERPRQSDAILVGQFGIGRQRQARSLADPMAELDGMIGLAGVKDEIGKLVDVLQADVSAPGSAVGRSRRRCTACSSATPAPVRPPSPG